MLSSESEIFLFGFLIGSITIDQFENWIYQTESLESEIPRQAYLELLDLHYADRHADLEIKRILLSFVDLGRFEDWKLRGILRSIVEKDTIAIQSIDNCYDLYCSGYYFLEIIALGFALHLRTLNYETSDWRLIPAETVENTLNSFYPRVRNEAIRILALLDDKKIVLTGRQAVSDNKLEYIDNQSPAEREISNFNNIKNVYVR